MTRGLRIFLLVAAALALLAWLGPRLGLIGCDSLPEFAAGPCSVGRSPDH